ncbi:glycosyltransferase family 4 protein [Pleurocapsales cyanobacterium LEGE 06147]|nr:glycosyltransferase family 4 protein [Pleurocapsales cyanobacterium LEGE 06147]
MNKNIGILFSSYGPYHIARLESLKNWTKSLQYQVTGIELARSQDEYPWITQINNLNFPIISVSKESSLEQIKISNLIQQLLITLKQNNPIALAISGYFKPSMLSALLWCLWHRKPAILFSETTEHDTPRVWWKEQLKSWIIKRYKSALVGGQPQKRYLIKLGMPAEAIFTGYDVVGNDTFHPDRIKSLPHPLNQPYFLAINRFVPKKNLFFLISAYAEYRQSAGISAWDLVLCGDGQLRPQIEKQIEQLGLENIVHLPGFLQQEELLPYFAHAGCFIHASIQEQWGLVVNEAMAAGLPVLVSNRCGCFEDLIIEGINGFGFDPENSEQLTNLMLKISAKEFDLAKMGQAALEHIQKFSPDYFARGLMQAVEYAIAHS